MRLKLVAALLLCMAEVVPAQDLAGLFRDTQSNAVGLADRYGYCALWKDVHDGVVMDGHRVPLRLRFCTAPDRQFGRVFGQGWWCPLLESCVVQRSENALALYTFGGERVDLYQTPGKPNQYTSKSQAWVGAVDGDDFNVVYKSGAELMFKDGRISMLKLGKGSYKWLYKDGVPVAIVDEKANKSLLEIRYTPNLLVSMILGSGIDLKAEYQEFPIAVSVGGTAGISNLKSSLGRLDSAGRELIDLSYELQPSDSRMAMRGTALGVDGAGKDLLIEWNVSNGLLERDELRTYSISPQENGVTRPKVTAIWKDGRVEWYAYNEKTGIAERLADDGRVLRNHYVLTPGPSFGKIRKGEQAPAQAPSDFKTTIVNYYDTDGELLRVVTPDKTTNFRGKAPRKNTGLLPLKEYDSLGRIISVVAPFSDELITFEYHTPSNTFALCSTQASAADANVPISDWVAALLETGKLSIRGTGETKVTGHPEESYVEPRQLFQYDGDKFSSRRALETKDGLERVFISACDGKSRYTIHPDIASMSIHTKKLEYAAEGFVWLNPVSILAASLHPTVSGEAFFHPGLPQLAERFKTLNPHSDGGVLSTKKVNTKFGEGLQIEWDTKRFFEKGRQYNWKKTRSVTIDLATGMPVAATFVNSSGDSVDELQVTEIETFVTRTGKKLALPKAYVFEMDKKGSAASWGYYWKATEIKPEQVLDAREFLPDPRQYGIKKVRDVESRQTFTLPE